MIGIPIVYTGIPVYIGYDPDEARAAQRSVACHALYFCGFSTMDEHREAVRGGRRSTERERRIRKYRRPIRRRTKVSGRQKTYGKLISWCYWRKNIGVMSVHEAWRGSPCSVPELILLNYSVLVWQVKQIGFLVLSWPRSQPSLDKLYKCNILDMCSDDSFGVHSKGLVGRYELIAVRHFTYWRSDCDSVMFWTRSVVWPYSQFVSIIVIRRMNENVLMGYRRLSSCDHYSDGYCYELVLRTIYCNNYYFYHYRLLLLLLNYCWCSWYKYYYYYYYYLYYYHKCIYWCCLDTQYNRGPGSGDSPIYLQSEFYSAPNRYTLPIPVRYPVYILISPHFTTPVTPHPFFACVTGVDFFLL